MLTKRILVIIIAVLALLSGWAQLFSGFIILGSGLLLLSAQLSAQMFKEVEAASQIIGLELLLVAIFLVINGAISNVFAFGAIMHKSWARFLGIFGYSLTIVTNVLMFLTASEQDSTLPYIVGTPIALTFIIILLFSKSAFEKPLQ